MLYTKNLTLKSPDQSDYDSLRKIRPCDEFYLMVGDEPTDSPFLDDEKFEKSFSESLLQEHYWHIFIDSEIIGITFLHSIDSKDRRAKYAVGLYTKQSWHKGYGQEITQAVLNYAFSELKLHKVELCVLAFNTRAIASYKKSGFVEEGRLRENAFINNKWHDDIIMSILRHEFIDKHKT